MGFWMFLFVCNLLIPLLMVIAGRMMYRHTPKSINGIYGYRTKMSMKNEETWKFAHDYCGRLWQKAGLVALALSAVVQLPFLRASEAVVGTVGGIISFAQVILLLCTILPVERALRANFDQDGRRR